MANIRFSKKEFEKHVKLTEDIKEKIAMFGTPFEGVEGDEVEIEVFPNRPDLLNMHGFLRGFLGFLGKKTGLAEYKLNKPEKNYSVTVDKSVADVRPYTTCAIVKGLKFSDEMIKEVIEIQEKLHNTLGRNRKKVAIGIYPLEKIKLPIKYEAREPEKIKFVPLEAHAEMTGRQILSGHPAGREYAHLLAEAKKFPVFVDAGAEVLSMPPIINSHKTGKITEKTKEIFIECSGFDIEVLKKCLNILITMFADMGGKVYQMDVKHKGGNYITPDLESEKMKINLENCNKLLGLELTEKEMIKCLEKMGYNYNKGEVEIPAWRVDVLHEHDLIEDVAIAYGYDKIEPEIPSISFAGQESIIEVNKQKIAQILAGLNMLEISNYHLTTVNDQFKKLGQKKENIIEVEDSKTEYNILRQNLLHYALKILSENVDAEYPQRIFELGKVFEKAGKFKEGEASGKLGSLGTGVKETEKLCIAIADNNANFTEIKQVLEYLVKMLGKECKIEQAGSAVPAFIEGRCGKIVVDGNEIGFLGEITPNILNNLKIKMPIAALEIDINSLL